MKTRAFLSPAFKRKCSMYFFGSFAKALSEEAFYGDRLLQSAGLGKNTMENNGGNAARQNPAGHGVRKLGCQCQNIRKILPSGQFVPSDNCSLSVLSES